MSAAESTFVVYNLSFTISRQGLNAVSEDKSLPDRCLHRANSQFSQQLVEVQDLLVRSRGIRKPGKQAVDDLGFAVTVGNFYDDAAIRIPS